MHRNSGYIRTLLIQNQIFTIKMRKGILIAITKKTSRNDQEPLLVRKHNRLISSLKTNPNYDSSIIKINNDF
ncbi:hypothetical protein BpHYR1_030008 [Brachionus plicatilis]|uniref:Uncharacterized protein n=1 Tax=Brachionus plicatilis TaxID=10195 RepID=A0A3M7QU46_BRAPC|nr:hypothetical protein BpHYR1_030008 [Brachionus plicatilis]